MKEITLRPEQAGDYRETENMTREAFWNQYGPGCNEHYLLHIMRDSPDFVSELNIVAVCDGRIVGNAVYAINKIAGNDGREYKVLGLGPIAVLPEFQGQGVGGRLIAHTRSLARELGYRAIFLLGDPDYYSRQGFLPAEQFGICTADGMYAAAHQVFPLYEGALEGITGRYLESDVYEVDRAAADEFDKEFPAKEKLSGTPSQLKFEKIVAMRHEAD